MSIQFSNVLICDDQYISVIGIESVLRKIQNLDFQVHHAFSGKEALAVYDNRKPDLVILDLNLPDLSGLEILKAMRLHTHQAKVIVLSGSDDPYLFQQVIQQNANAVLRKLNSHQNIQEAVDFIRRGENSVFIDPSAESLMKNSMNLSLTRREYEVVQLIAQGLTGQEIADKLGCSLATIKTYRMRIMNKSGARNSSEILAWFLTKGNVKRDGSTYP